MPFLKGLDDEPLLGLGPWWFLNLGDNLELIAGVGNVWDVAECCHIALGAHEMHC